jgi:hypothetical protein
VPQWLARNIAQEWNRAIKQGPDAGRIADKAASTERALRKSWGEAYERKIAAARSLILSVESDEVSELLDRSGLANSEYLIRQLAALTESRQARRSS